MSGLAETARNQIMGMTAMSDNDNDLIRRGDAIEALKAANLPFGYGQAVHAITNVPAVQVTVKPLVWEHGQNVLRMDSTMMMGNGYDFDTMELTRQEGYGFGCGYIIWAIRSGLGKKSWNVYGILDGIFIQDITSEDAAKDAAQADYEARIRSALTIAPAPDAAKVAALVEAAEARARIDELEAFIADFASAKFDSLPRPLVRHPADEPDPVTDATVVWSWQEDANELLKGEKK